MEWDGAGGALKTSALKRPLKGSRWSRSAETLAFRRPGGRCFHPPQRTQETDLPLLKALRLLAWFLPWTRSLWGQSLRPCRSLEKAGHQSSEDGRAFRLGGLCPY